MNYKDSGNGIPDYNDSLNQEENRLRSMHPATNFSRHLLLSSSWTGQAADYSYDSYQVCFYCRPII